MDIEFRFNELSEIAKARMNEAPYSPHLVYAEIFWFTEKELVEFMSLRRQLIDWEKANLAAKIFIKRTLRKLSTKDLRK